MASQGLASLQPVLADALARLTIYYAIFMLQYYITRSIK
jgi:hypothetical protein